MALVYRVQMLIVQRFKGSQFKTEKRPTQS